MRLADLEIPAQPEFVSLARLVVSAIAVDRYELSDDQIDDLKLALSEACVLAIEGDSPAEVVQVACEGDDAALNVLISSSRPSFGVGASTPANALGEMTLSGATFGLPLIASLVDEMLVEPAGDGDRLCLTVRCPQAISA